MKKNKIIKLLTITSLTAGTITIINKFIFLSSTIRNMLFKEDANYYNWRFGRIFYTKEGEGKPLLLIHDLSSDSCDYEWTYLKKYLTKKYTVYTLDLLGCGRSEKPDFTYTNFLYVELLNDFVKNVIGHRTNIITSGCSSSLAIMACSYNDELFDKLMFINPESFSESNLIPTGSKKILKMFISLPIIGTLVYNIIHNKKQIAYTLQVDKYFSPNKVTEIDIQAFHEASHIGGYKAKFLFSSLKGNFIKIPVTQTIKNIDNSIFIIGGESEIAVDSILKEYVESNPSIETDKISNCKHYPHMEQPQKVFEDIYMFFQ